MKTVTLFFLLAASVASVFAAPIPSPGEKTPNNFEEPGLTSRHRSRSSSTTRWAGDRVRHRPLSTEEANGSDWRGNRQLRHVRRIGYRRWKIGVYGKERPDGCRRRTRGPVTQTLEWWGTAFSSEIVLLIRIGCDLRQARKDPRIVSPL